MAAEALGQPPQPSLNADTEFFWRGLQQRRLLLQRCAACALLRHPPGPACPTCHCLDWDVHESRGAGVVVSFVVVHRPRHPGFDYPLTVGLVELEGGVRLVAPLAMDGGVTPEIGMRVEAVIEPVEGQHRLPTFRTVRGTVPHA